MEFIASMKAAPKSEKNNLKINAIYYTNKLKKKNYKFISIDAGKAFDKL